MDDFITIRDAAKALYVSESTIRRYFDEGKLEGHVTPAGTRRIHRWSLRLLLEQTGIAPTGITFPQ